MTPAVLGLALESLALAGLAAALWLAVGAPSPNLKIWVLLAGWLGVLSLALQVGAGWSPAVMARWVGWGGLLVSASWALGHPNRAWLALAVTLAVWALTPFPPAWPLWAALAFVAGRVSLTVWLAWALASSLGRPLRPAWGGLWASLSLWLWWALAPALLNRPADALLTALGLGWWLGAAALVALWALSVWPVRPRWLTAGLALWVTGTALLPTLATQPQAWPRTFDLTGPDARATLTLQPARLSTLGVQVRLWDEAGQPLAVESGRAMFVPVGGGAVMAQRALTPQADGTLTARPFLLTRTGAWQFLLTVQPLNRPETFATLALRADADWVIRLSEEPVPLTAQLAQTLDDLGPAVWAGSALTLTIAWLSVMRRRFRHMPL